MSCHRDLDAAEQALTAKLRAHPMPVSDCHAQCDHLIALRDAVSGTPAALEPPPTVATPRNHAPDTGVESR